MDKLKSALPLLLCALFLWGYSLLDLLAPAREFSEMENRYLKQAPVPSLRGILFNRYTLEYEEYINDQFAGRDGWITLKSVAESVLGKRENNGVVYGADGYLFEKYLALNERQLEKNLGYLQSFAEGYPGESLNITVIPSAYAVLADKLPQGLHNVDQISEMEGIYSRMSRQGWAARDILPALESHKEQYIYYRTDHHWTTFGAWLAYSSLMEQTHRPAVDAETLPRHEVEGFYGTHYSKAKLYSARPDTIAWYDIPAASVTVDGEAADGLYDLEMFGKRDKYAAFLWGNNALSVIRGPASQAGEEPSRILLFGDSYSNSLAPFLACSFDEVYLVDLRYFSDVHTLMAETKFDEILVLYGFDSLAEDVHLAKLAAQ